MEHEDFLEPNLSIGEARQLIRSLKQLRNTPIPASILARIRDQLSLNIANDAQHISNSILPPPQGLGEVLPVRQLKQCVDDETQPSVEMHNPAQKKTANKREMLPAGSKMDDDNLDGNYGERTFTRHVDTIGNYQITKVIAIGSSASIYMALHRHLDRVVAIKIPRTTLLFSEDEHDGFLREARILEMLKHRYILPFLDFGIDEGLPYIVTEFAEGNSLRNRIKRNRQQALPILEALKVITQIGEALHYAHRHHIVHRDIKPENVLFNASGDALLADFGIAFFETLMMKRHSSSIIGTPSYMAPEQFHGYATPQSDQYALACLAYELCTGSKPFVGNSFITLMNMHLYCTPLRPIHKNPKIPRFVENAILKAMSKREEDRYESVQAFLSALQQAFVPKVSTQAIKHRLHLSTAAKTEAQWIEEGIMFRKKGQYEQALIADEQAIHLNPYCEEAYNNKGNTLFFLKRYEEALQCYEQATTLDSSFATAFNHIGVVLQYLGRYEQAIAYHERAILLAPEFASAFNYEGNALYRLQRYKEALAMYEQAILLESENKQYHYNKAKALLRLNRQQEAEEAERLAREIENWQHPGNRKDSYPIPRWREPRSTPYMTLPPGLLSCS